jgi:hypothetical protein
VPGAAGEGGGDEEGCAAEKAESDAAGGDRSNLRYGYVLAG